MQTFLPYPSFQQSALCLDRQRLGKQRVEARQIFKTLCEGGCWSSHPAVKMWKGYEEALILYGNAMISEWIDRGYENNMKVYDFTTRSWVGFKSGDSVEMAFESGHNVPMMYDLLSMPHWLGDDRLHASHRSNLLRKDSEWYGKFGWEESPYLHYWWPDGIGMSERQ